MEIALERTMKYEKFGWILLDMQCWKLLQEFEIGQGYHGISHSHGLEMPERARGSSTSWPGCSGGFHSGWGAPSECGFLRAAGRRSRCHDARYQGCLPFLARNSDWNPCSVNSSSGSSPIWLDLVWRSLLRDLNPNKTHDFCHIHRGQAARRTHPDFFRTKPKEESGAARRWGLELSSVGLEMSLAPKMVTFKGMGKWWQTMINHDICSMGALFSDNPRRVCPTCPHFNGEMMMDHETPYCPTKPYVPCST